MPDQSPNPATTSGPSSAVGQQQSLHVPSVHRSKRVSLRRTTIRKAGNFQLNGTFQFTHTFPDVGIHLFIDVDHQWIVLQCCVLLFSLVIMSYPACSTIFILHYHKLYRAQKTQYHSPVKSSGSKLLRKPLLDYQFHILLNTREPAWSNRKLKFLLIHWVM